MAKKKKKARPKKKRPSRAKKKVSKKAKPKAKSRKPVSDVRIVSTAGLTFVKAPKRGSKYDGILEKMLKLKAGQSVLISVPKGISPLVYQNRLNSHFAKVKPRHPPGCSFHKHTTKDGKIAISCTKN